MNFLEAVGNRRLDLGLAIDIEKQGNPEGISRDMIVERLVTMAEYLYLKGHRVTFYTNKTGYEEYLMEAFPGYPLWICSFPNIQ